MGFKTGDKVIVTTGKDKGKEGKITKVLHSTNQVLVEGINMMKKHVKPNGNQPGSIVEQEALINASNVMILDPKTKKATRMGHEIDKKGNKVRVTKKSNSVLE